MIQTAARILFAIGVAAIIVLSLGPSVPGGALGLDKLQHLLAYFAVSVCGFHGFARRFLPLFVFMVALGATLEVAQMALAPHRSGELADLAANVLGVGLAAICIGALARRRAAGREAGVG